MQFPLPKSAHSLPHRVVVTGAGIVTALGCGWQVNSQSLRSGRTAFRPVTLFDISRQRAQLAGEVALPAEVFSGGPHAKNERRRGRAAQMLQIAAREAWTQSGWQGGETTPIVLGTTSGEMALGEDYYRQAVNSPADRRNQATRVIHYQAQRQGLDLGETFGAYGPLTIIANACASGSNAIGHAFELVRTGRAPRAFTGGYDALSLLTFAGFDALRALSPTACRPFDAGRDGVLLGEGAAMVTLETLGEAQARGATILGEIAGYGAATDTHHLTQPHPEGKAALAAMTMACQQAGLRPEQIDYINAHGTATPQNDATEAAAINRWAGVAAPQLRVSSTKANTGHTLGAAGAIEAVICLMTLVEQWLPPQAGLRTPDPACQFKLVTEKSETGVAAALSNSFGFGGANASLIFRRWL